MHLPALCQTNYADNVVICKLFGILGASSPPEFIFDFTIYRKLNDWRSDWKCWVYSGDEYQQQVVEQKEVYYPRLFALVPRTLIPHVGEVDLAVYIPSHSKCHPVAVLECDGHEFHERTPEQASKDRRRIRELQYLGIPILPFTGTDIVRGSEELAQELLERIIEPALSRIVSDASGLRIQTVQR